MKENSALSNAYKALERASYTPEQLLEYDRYAWKEEEIQTRINDARLAGEKAGEEKGVQKGRAEGIEKGRAEERAKAHSEKIEMAKGMLADGLSVDVVSKYSGLSASEIEALKNY